ncbi:hypothetical protein PHLCEN_2v10279 [Hermanssonia centrifuga]|uniref:Uncharacterized protein n=1 Tax=Hermanssonia centrifuga TaxID=98765 RepID=A0A2R6NND8_9APHY|nr:hypothetical protein PHLCEN_2v10279 [Hermanssonia centrifuga]
MFIINLTSVLLLDQNVIGWKGLFGRIAHKTHIDIRRRALRKLEREAKKQ